MISNNEKFNYKKKIANTRQYGIRQASKIYIIITVQKFVCVRNSEPSIKSFTLNRNILCEGSFVFMYYKIKIHYKVLKTPAVRELG